MMQVISEIDFLSTLCKMSKKWGIQLNFNSVVSDEDMAAYHNGLPMASSEEELRKAAPWLPDYDSLWYYGTCIVLFDTEEELLYAYNRTVGDDGPTAENTYDGPARVYARTCDPHGNLITENT